LEWGLCSSCWNANSKNGVTCYEANGQCPQSGGIAMNYFVLMAGILYLGASVKYLVDGSWKMAVAFVCYAIANFMLSLIKE
jgi:hypothetical protein